MTQRHTCVTQAQEISNMLNELSSTVEEGVEFTLKQINMFGNSNFLHLTSLCEKKGRGTFDNGIFHMIRAGWKNAFERQWSPGKLFVDHTTTISLRLSDLWGMRNSFGKQINSSFSWQSHWELKGKPRRRQEWGKTNVKWFWFFFEEICTKKKSCSFCSNMHMLCKHLKTSLSFHRGCFE